MSSSNNEVISKACPHTIKKFELISEYVKAWIEKLMNFNECTGIVYIDCMSNSGVYKDNDGNEIEGTPLRVSKIIADAMIKYSSKQAYLYFNDIDQKKIEMLETRLPKKTGNFNVYTTMIDANELLRKISSQFGVYQKMHFLLLYDPYEADIDWDAIMPYLRNWGEVILNHMLSDTVRAARVAKNPEAIEKYEKTYQTSIEELISFGSDKKEFEKKIKNIIKELSGRKENQYYIASFPFFNSMNTVVYNLVHCTGHIKGFRLFKTTAWKTFGGKSSMKNTHNVESQIQICVDEKTGDFNLTTTSDEYCYYVHDIASYVQKHFRGQTDVPYDEIWAYLDEHPVFPNDSYKRQITLALKNDYGAKTTQKNVVFADRSG